MKVDKGDRIAVFLGGLGHSLPGMGRAKKGDFDEMFNLFAFADLEKGGKDVCPSLDVGKGAKDSPDSSKSGFKVYKEAE